MKVCVFERKYDVLMSKRPCFLLNKNLNFNKNKRKLIMEPCAPGHIRVRASERKGRTFFCTFSFCLKEIFLTFVFYPNVYCIEYNFRIYIPLRIKKHYFIHFLTCF